MAETSVSNDQAEEAGGVPRLTLFFQTVSSRRGSCTRESCTGLEVSQCVSGRGGTSFAHLEVSEKLPGESGGVRVIEALRDIRTDVSKCRAQQDGDESAPEKGGGKEEAWCNSPDSSAAPPPQRRPSSRA